YLGAGSLDGADRVADPLGFVVRWNHDTHGDQTVTDSALTRPPCSRSESGAALIASVTTTSRMFTLGLQKVQTCQ
ncbi:MAG: hypothetical protein ABIP03_10320, partial [Aquihabitans sp.]